MTPVSEQLFEVLDDQQGKTAVGDLISQWKTLTKLKVSFSNYIKVTQGKLTQEADIESLNESQFYLRKTFDPFFESLHKGLKKIDKIVRIHEKTNTDIAKAKNKRTTVDKETKKLKQALELLHKEVKNAENYFKHINWLQERFPLAKYEDVTGLCKLATQEEVALQDYSLNASRYVGIVIEEDGKTEEEFISDILMLNEELASLNKFSHETSKVICNNIKNLAGE